ncbi:class I SAM-dependent methyltransferase [Methylomonas sp. YC3]
MQLANAPVDYYKTVITAATLSPNLKQNRLSYFGDIFTKLSSPKPTAIEIGCASGENLELLTETGFDGIGIEYRPHHLLKNQISRRNIIDCYIEELDGSHASKYDFVVSFNYLEHQPNQHEFLKKLWAITKPDGYVLITVPNLDYLLQTHCLYEFVADHLVYYTANTLVGAFAKFGFSIIECRLINNENDIFLLVKKVARTDLDISRLKLAKLVNVFNDLLTDLTNKGHKIAVWGAGHRTLALLSLVSSDLLTCILDSAEFKQGKYAPVTHLPILSPNILNCPENIIDVVIVMLPGVFPAEAVKSLKLLNNGVIVYQFVNNCFMLMNHD